MSHYTHNSNGYPGMHQQNQSRGGAGGAGYMGMGGMVGHSNSSPSQIYPPGLLASISVDYAQCFCVPLSNIPGPSRMDVVYSTPGALERWTHPPRAPQGAKPSTLPVHQKAIKDLKKLCAELNGDIKCSVAVTEMEPQVVLAGTRRGAVATVTLSGPQQMVLLAREKILQQSTGPLKSDSVEVEAEMFVDTSNWTLLESIGGELSKCSQITGADIFLLKSRPASVSLGGFDPLRDANLQKEKIKIAIYGDMDTVEHGKTRILLLIDKLLGLMTGSIAVDHKLQALLCGKNRKFIKRVEAQTSTSIYFPPALPEIYGPTPDQYKRHDDEVFISGRTERDIEQAKELISSHAFNVRMQSKAVMIPQLKSDYLLLERLDEIKKIMFETGTNVDFRPIGNPHSEFEVSGPEVTAIDRSIKAVTALCGSFYSAHWWILGDPGRNFGCEMPNSNDIHKMLVEICAASGAEIVFSKHVFLVNGLDESVKNALNRLSAIPFLHHSPHQIQTKIQLSNEHKEFVSGKKNGKLNKIMGSATVQIAFNDFNEFDFQIDIQATDIEYALRGIELVELELPASVTFHVPDQYHKRIIGVGGSHIQAIMKKYSVFVKFTNAMELSASDRDFSDQSKVNNVICRTPARNAQNLELVKGEIMDMVQQEDAEIVTETVTVPRVLHRGLQSQIRVIQDVERKWGCTITFPSTETGSDSIVIRGPEWQVPSAVSEFLALVPDTHKVFVPYSDHLEKILEATEFKRDVKQVIEAQFHIDICLPASQTVRKNDSNAMRQVLFAFTRRDAGSLQDAIEYFLNYLFSKGIKTDSVQGRIPRPKSDSFEDTCAFFASKVFSGPPVSQSSSNSSPTSRPRNRLSNGSLGSSVSELRERTSMNEIEAAFNSGTGEQLDSLGTAMRKASNGSLASSASSALASASSLGVSHSSTAASSVSGDHTPTPHHNSATLMDMSAQTRYQANYHAARRIMTAQSMGMPTTSLLNLDAPSLPKQSIPAGLGMGGMNLNMAMANMSLNGGGVPMRTSMAAGGLLLSNNPLALNGMSGFGLHDNGIPQHHARMQPPVIPPRRRWDYQV